MPWRKPLKATAPLQRRVGVTGSQETEWWYQFLFASNSKIRSQTGCVKKGKAISFFLISTDFFCKNSKALASGLFFWSRTLWKFAGTAPITSPICTSSPFSSESHCESNIKCICTGNGVPSVSILPDAPSARRRFSSLSRGLSMAGITAWFMCAPKQACIPYPHKI